MDNGQNSKKSLIILIIVFVLIIAVSAVLYNIFAKDSASGGLVQTENEYANENGTEESTGVTETDEKAELPDKVPNKKVPLAPDFTVEDIDGNKYKLSDFRGKPVIINFWASWCGPCKKEMPDFEELYKEYGSEINFLMVNLTDGKRETKKKASEHINAEGYTFPVYFDTRLEAAYAYGVSSIPATYFIDSEGYPVVYGAGRLNKATLLNGIGMFPEYRK